MKKKRKVKVKEVIIIFLLLLLIVVLFKPKILPSPPQATIIRMLPSSMNINDFSNVNLDLIIDDISNIESILIIESVPYGFEVFDIKPEPTLFYGNMIVWGYEGYVPASGQVYSYDIKALEQGSFEFDGTIGIVMLNKNEQDYDVVGDKYIFVLSRGGGGGDSGTGGGESFGDGVSIPNITESENKSETEKEAEKEVPEKIEEAFNYVLYLIIGIIVVLFILIILLRKKRIKKR